MDLFLFLFCLVVAMSLCASLYVLCGHLLGKADLLALVCGGLV